MKKIKNPFLGHKDYCCFACAPNNSIGLKMEFMDDGESLISDWKPDDRFQGYKNILHGGIQATLMDEIASWFILSKLGTAGVTSRMQTRHRKPIFTNKGNLKIKASLREKNSRIASIDVEIYNNDGSLGSSGVIDYFILPPDKAVEDLMYPGKKAFY